MTPPAELTRRLLALAERDMVSFRALAGHPEVDISTTGFFAQQAVKKCLKAVAEYHGIVFRRTRDALKIDQFLCTPAFSLFSPYPA